MTPILAPERPSDTNQIPTIYSEPVGIATDAQWCNNVAAHIRSTSAIRQASSPLKEILARSQKFQQLTDEWHRDTDIVSSPTKKKNHRAYQRILAMGTAAVPYILRDLRDRGGDWYEALADITGESPIPAEAQGDVGRMNESWFRWGRERGLID